VANGLQVARPRGAQNRKQNGIPLRDLFAPFSPVGRGGARGVLDSCIIRSRRGCGYIASSLRMLAEMREQPGGSGVNMAMFAAVLPDRSRWCIAFRRFFYLAV
jgi:hypothetical protein